MCLAKDKYEVILVKNKNLKNNKKAIKDNDDNLFNEMSYELAGDIGAIDNDEMVNNKKLVTEKNNNDNIFTEMASEFAGPRGSIDSEDMVNNPKRRNVRNDKNK